MIFRDRVEAGEKLALALKQYTGHKSIIYALPRGGVEVGAKAAQTLQLPLSLLIIRKIGHPFNPEYAIGAVSEKGPPVFNEAEMAFLNPGWLDQAVEKERREARRRRLAYLKGKQPRSAANKVAVIIDDGVATGLTMLAAVAEVKRQKPQKIVVAVPVAPPEVLDQIRREVDDTVVLYVPRRFSGSVGAYYRRFIQVSDQKVVNLLENLST